MGCELMGDYLGAFLDELLGIIGTMWPEITLPGDRRKATCFTSIVAARANIVERAKNPATPPPYAIIVLGKATNDQEWTIDAEMLRTPISFWYIGNGNLSQVELNQKLFLMWNHITSNSFQTFQEIERGAMDSSDSNAFNSSILADSKVLLIGGEVYWSPGFMVSLT